MVMTDCFSVSVLRLAAGVCLAKCWEEAKSMGAPEGAAAIGGPVAVEGTSVSSDKSLPQTGRTNGWKDGLIQFKDENETHTAHLETRTQILKLYSGCAQGDRHWAGVDGCG